MQDCKDGSGLQFVSFDFVTGWQSINQNRHLGEILLLFMISLHSSLLAIKIINKLKASSWP